jgi:hypothetical protein
MPHLLHNSCQQFIIKTSSTVFFEELQNTRDGPWVGQTNRCKLTCRKPVKFLSHLVEEVDLEQIGLELLQLNLMLCFQSLGSICNQSRNSRLHRYLFVC